MGFEFWGSVSFVGTIIASYLFFICFTGLVK